MSRDQIEKESNKFAATSREESISAQELIILLTRLVPDKPIPTEIMFEIVDNNRILWLEGWCDGCIAGKGFPPKGEGRLQEKLDYIRGQTPELLQQRAKERNTMVRNMGFVPLNDREYLYGVSWAIFEKIGDS